MRRASIVEPTGNEALLKVTIGKDADRQDKIPNAADFHLRSVDHVA